MLLLLAAFTHDIDHPGVNAPFLLKTNDFLSKIATHSVRSELKNIHSVRCAQICDMRRCVVHGVSNFSSASGSLINNLTEYRFVNTSPHQHGNIHYIWLSILYIQLRHTISNNNLKVCPLCRAVKDCDSAVV
jgi:hypothetical protein